MEKFVDVHKDIQTVGLLAVHCNFLGFPEASKLERWYRTYKAYLNRQNNFEQRSVLDKQCLQLMKTEEFDLMCATSLVCSHCSCQLS